MAGTHVRVRIPSAGTVAGDVVRARPGARLACIEVGRRRTALGLVVDHFGLAEGLTDGDIEALLAQWCARYRAAAAPMGAPFALHLPLPLAHATPEVARMHQHDLGAARPVGHVLSGADCDLWIACPDAPHAETLAASLRPLLAGAGGSAAVGDPSTADLECWAALRLASEVGVGLGIVDAGA